MRAHDNGQRHLAEPLIGTPTTQAARTPGSPSSTARTCDGRDGADRVVDVQERFITDGGLVRAAQPSR